MALGFATPDPGEAPPMAEFNMISAVKEFIPILQKNSIYYHFFFNYMQVWIIE